MSATPGPFGPAVAGRRLAGRLTAVWSSGVVAVVGPRIGGVRRGWAPDCL
jgi:hypothetical protein